DLHHRLAIGIRLGGDGICARGRAAVGVDSRVGTTGIGVASFTGSPDRGSKVVVGEVQGQRKGAELGNLLFLLKGLPVSGEGGVKTSVDFVCSPFQDQVDKGLGLALERLSPDRIR
ncbi:MAG: hypothetical protein NT096_01380, partial [Proteobacteria bacterium]|nr:hypothetical protein [Pseudomonadota bacterium]